MDQEKNNFPVRITLIAGLPGSGKSHLLSRMEAADSMIRGMDDISINKDFIDSIHYYLHYDVPNLSVRHLVLSDPLLVSHVYRKSLIKALVNIGVTIDDIDLILFENCPEQCLVNSMNRPDKPVMGLILQLTKEYDEDNLIVEVNDGNYVLMNLIKKSVWKPKEKN